VKRTTYPILYEATCLAPQIFFLLVRLSIAVFNVLNTIPATPRHATTAIMCNKQVKAGSIFDNILVCDDAEFAKAEAEKNIIPLMAKEKEMKKTADDGESEKRRKDEVIFFCDAFQILIFCHILEHYNLCA